MPLTWTLIWASLSFPTNLSLMLGRTLTHRSLETSLEFMYCRLLIYCMHAKTNTHSNISSQFFHFIEHFYLLFLLLCVGLILSLSLLYLLFYYVAVSIRTGSLAAFLSSNALYSDYYNGHTGILCHCVLSSTLQCVVLNLLCLNFLFIYLNLLCLNFYSFIPYSFIPFHMYFLYTFVIHVAIYYCTDIAGL